MMKLGIFSLGALALAASFNAQAGASLDVYYVPSEELKIGVSGLGSESQDGDGFGGKGVFSFGTSGALISAEYQATEIDDFDVEIKQARVGGGWMRPHETFSFGGYGEYVALEFESGDGSADASGFGVHGRLEFAPAPALTLHAQAGYLSLSDDDSDEDLTGPEYSIGAAYAFSPTIGGFADYRYTNLETDDGGGEAEFELNTVRVGVRFVFGE